MLVYRRNACLVWFVLFCCWFLGAWCVSNTLTGRSLDWVGGVVCDGSIGFLLLILSARTQRLVLGFSSICFSYWWSLRFRSNISTDFELLRFTLRRYSTITSAFGSPFLPKIHSHSLSWCGMGSEGTGFAKYRAWAVLRLVFVARHSFLFGYIVFLGTVIAFLVHALVCFVLLGTGCVRVGCCWFRTCWWCVDCGEICAFEYECVSVKCTLLPFSLDFFVGAVVQSFLLKWSYSD